MTSNYFDEKDLYTEILPMLWIGSTDEDDLVGMARRQPSLQDRSLFDTVITLNPIANPFGWYVKEFRYGFPDGKLTDNDVITLVEIAEFGFKTWRQKKHVMVRCQAGMNRSALVIAMILIKSGKSAIDAIDLIRNKRSPYCLSNKDFVDFLFEYQP